MEILLRNERVKVNDQTDSGSSALMFAAVGGFGDVLQQLLNHEDIDVSLASTCRPKEPGMTCRVKGETALMMAASWNRTEVVRLLIEHETFVASCQKNEHGVCSCNEKNKEHEWTALMYSAL